MFCNIFRKLLYFNNWCNWCISVWLALRVNKNLAALWGHNPDFFQIFQYSFTQKGFHSLYHSPSQSFSKDYDFDNSKYYRCLRLMGKLLPTNPAANIFPPPPVPLTSCSGFGGVLRRALLEKKHKIGQSFREPERLSKTFGSQKKKSNFCSGKKMGKYRVPCGYSVVIRNPGVLKYLHLLISIYVCFKLQPLQMCNIRVGEKKHRIFGKLSRIVFVLWVIMGWATSK